MRANIGGESTSLRSQSYCRLARSANPLWLARERRRDTAIIVSPPGKGNAWKMRSYVGVSMSVKRQLLQAKHDRLEKRIDALYTDKVGGEISSGYYKKKSWRSGARK